MFPPLTVRQLISMGQAKKKLREKKTPEEREAETARKVEMRAYYKGCKGKPKEKARHTSACHGTDGGVDIW